MFVRVILTKNLLSCQHFMIYKCNMHF